jgi:hypothetical protein
MKVAMRARARTVLIVSVPATKPRLTGDLPRLDPWGSVVSCQSILIGYNNGGEQHISFRGVIDFLLSLYLVCSSGPSKVRGRKVREQRGSQGTGRSRQRSTQLSAEGSSMREEIGRMLYKM